MARLINKASVVSIMNKRGRLDESLVGKKVQFTVQGNGTRIDVKTKEGQLVQSVVEQGTVFQKVIFNLQANSSIAAKSDAVRKLAAAGLAAEMAGNAEEAHKHFTAYLNAMQVSFSVPTTSPPFSVGRSCGHRGKGRQSHYREWFSVDYRSYHYPCSSA